MFEQTSPRVMTPRPGDEWIAEWRAAIRARLERHAAARTPVAAMAAEHWPPVGTYWDGAAVDGELLTDVERAAPADDLTGAPLLEHIEALERVEAHTLGLKFRTVAAFIRDYRVQCSVPGGPQVSDPQLLKSATCELAFLLRMTPGATETLVGKAMRLAESLPATLDALEGGAISRQSADVILLETAAMEAEDLPAVEARLYPAAFELSPPEIRRLLTDIINELDPEHVRKRHQRERAHRQVRLDPAPYGMAWLSAYLPADQAQAMYEVINAHARTYPADGRSYDERRADALRDLLLEPAAFPRPRVSVQLRVVVPFGTVLGLTDEPGELAGYGPIPADMARELAANATWRRILTDPVEGTVLDYGTTRYRATAPLAERLAARDRTCRSPHCVMAAHKCDTDHATPWRADGSGGRTSEHETGRSASSTTPSDICPAGPWNRNRTTPSSGPPRTERSTGPGHMASLRSAGES